MSWMEVTHDEEGRPDFDTLPPNDSMIEFLRVQSVLTDGVRRWIHLMGRVNRYDYEGYENASVNGPTVSLGDPEEGWPTEAGIYWRLAKPSECATVEP